MPFLSPNQQVLQDDYNAKHLREMWIIILSTFNVLFISKQDFMRRHIMFVMLWYTPQYVIYSKHTETLNILLLLWQACKVLLQKFPSLLIFWEPT